MIYEPGTLQCRLLIEAKESLLTVIKSLSNVPNVEDIQSQLLCIYNELEEKHDSARSHSKSFY